MNLPATQRTLAYEKFMGGMKLTEIAKELDLVYQTLAKWSSEEGWMAKREALEQEAFAIIENDYKKFVLSNRKNVATRHLDYAKQIEDRIILLFKKNPATGNYLYHTPTQIKDLTMALKAATDISARVVNIDKIVAANVNIKIAPIIVTGINARPRKAILATQSPELAPKSNENGSVPVLEAEFEEVPSLPPF